MKDISDQEAAMTKDTSVKNDGHEYDSMNNLLGPGRNNIKNNTSSSRKASISTKNNAVAPYSLEDQFSNEDDISKPPQMVGDNSVSIQLVEPAMKTD